LFLAVYGGLAALFFAPVLLFYFLASLAWRGQEMRMIAQSMALVAICGLLVGFGSRMGIGCTSGHGVCGFARLSVRSIAATLIFMATAVITVAIVRHGFGG